MSWYICASGQRRSPQRIQMQSLSSRCEFVPRLCTTSERSQPGSSQGHSPLIVCQLLLQQKHFGLELVPLVQHIPQFLQCEPGAVGVLEIHGHLLRLGDTRVSAQLHLEEGRDAANEFLAAATSTHSASCRSPNFPPSQGLSSLLRTLF